MSASLYLIEAVPHTAGRREALDLVEAVSRRVAAVGAELIESQVAGQGERVFAVVEAADAGALTAAVRELEGAAEVSEPAPVRLVGADLEQIKATRPEAGYLVEWDIPATIDMDTYLARKKANSPKYAEVPEVAFLRTYVREDMAKCLCLYDAPDVATVERARAVVSTPIDRLHTLLSLESLGSAGSPR